MALTSVGINRRTLVSAAALGVADTLSANAGERPWYLDLRRAAFHNLNEYDPKVLDIESWMDYWSSLQPQLFVVSCGGLMAFYPTRLECHPRSQFLGERDVNAWCRFTTILHPVGMPVHDADNFHVAGRATRRRFGITDAAPERVLTRK